MNNSLGKQKQILETKHMISEALRNLIIENSYNDITIYHILEKAGVSRRTFYRHFNNKDDVLDFTLTTFILNYYNERTKLLSATSPEDVFYVTLSFMYDHRQFIRSLILSEQYDKFTSKFDKNSEIIFKAFDIPWNQAQKDSHRKSYFQIALVGAYLNVIKYWLTSENIELPEIIAKDLAVLFSALPNYFTSFDSIEREETLNKLKDNVEKEIFIDNSDLKSY